MSNTNESSISPAERERLQQLFAHGNKQMSIGSFDYADEMFFAPCVLGDPGNIIYFKTFLANLKKKFGDKKKKGVFGFLSGGKKTTGSKKPEQTLKSAIAAIRANPWDVSAFLSGGGACDELGYHEVATEYYRAAVEAEPFDVDANWTCAAALRELADYDGALACVHRILKNNPKDQEAIKLRNDLTVEKTIHKGKYATGDSSQVRETAAGAKVVAEDEDAMGRPLTYLEQVERRIKKNPDDLANYLELAQYFYQQGDYDKAEGYFAKSVKLSKNSPDMIERYLDNQKQKLLAVVTQIKEEYEQTKDKSLVPKFDEAKKVYEEKNIELARHRIKHYPNHSGYHFEYGVLLQKQKQFKEAITEFQTAKIDGTKKGDCLLALGQCFQQIKQYPLAMMHYKEAIEALPDSGDNKKKALYLATKLAMALEDYETAGRYSQQLAAIDFSYKDLGELLDKIAKRGQN